MKSRQILLFESFNLSKYPDIDYSYRGYVEGKRKSFIAMQDIIDALCADPECKILSSDKVVAKSRLRKTTVWEVPLTKLI